MAAEVLRLADIFSLQMGQEVTSCMQTEQRVSA